ncbi:arylsulfatase [Algoriphagus halophytocola]|uniref:Arylsulfatase n=1 Tax=Algoriphagus halophytocola TaxID=2991499 RepID=A0ABY6MDG1_9BACT|nr:MULTISPECIES: arylsulfatase [unclassified Algoriphagus]UZD21424.1 arylsulfatase [Algoriphagus sp. TR-M5]WBL42636.1 arylsulfatase [Algoriphagus sp. TR-M9]
MKNLLLLVICGICIACDTKEPEVQSPNVILILADDLGYGEVGYQGQKKIKTPNIDALSETGMVFTNHYSGAPVCAPARCVLLTGKHMGHAYIRGNDAMKERGDVWDYAKAAADPNLEGQRNIPANTETLSKMLQKAGYKTGIVGKWGLGGPMTEGIPTNLGFDYFYGYNCQRQAHNLYPNHLWENEEKILLDNELVVPATKLEPGADPNDPASYAKYEQKDYAPDLMHEKALSFIQENKDEPFFLYYASPLPHVPLQIPSEDRESYIAEFGTEEPYDGSKGYFPNQYPNATYAAMISKLDQQIGEVRARVKELGLEENTIIIVTSDNGPTYAGGVDSEYFESSTPFANGFGRTKGFLYEGGIRVPMLVSWPGKITQSTSDHISVFYDIFPTLAELVGMPVPEELDGKSFLPELMGEAQEKHDYLYWEFPETGGQQAVRMGKWKAVRQNIKKENNLEIELYDLSNDILEQNNLAAEHPDLIKEFEEIMAKEHEAPEVSTFRMPALGD